MYNKHIKTDIRYRRDPFVAVSVEDSAIRKEDSDLSTYQRTRDMNALKFGEEKPTYFHLRLLSDLQLRQVVESLQVQGRLLTSMVYRNCFAQCLVKAENLCVLDKDGNVREIGVYQPTRLDNGFIEGKEIEEYFPSAIIDEIGRVAFERHFLAQGTLAQFGI